MKFGLTNEFPCSYLDDRQERLLVQINDEGSTQDNTYDELILKGFRRSGDQIYRPHCRSCNQCKSVRIDVNQFTPSRSQKRILNKNRDLALHWQEKDSERDLNEQFNQYFYLYADYISERHREGSMFPPDIHSFINFNYCYWRQPGFIEAYEDNRIVAVAVTDVTQTGLSAFYTFYDPHLDKRSLGTYMILQQIERCKAMNMPYLYLGYYIAQSPKMNYKRNFNALEFFNGEFWQALNSE